MGQGVAAGGDLEQIHAALEAVASLVLQIGNEVGPGTVRGADVIIERRRSEVYDAMGGVGLAVHEFLRSNPPPERLAAAQQLVLGKLREIGLTSPITLYGSQRKRQQVSYFEIVEHVRAGRLAGADVAARVLDDYYVHTEIARAFSNRMAMLKQQLLDELSRCDATRSESVRVLSLQYVGGADLLLLAQREEGLNGVLVTCIDSDAAAVRHAEQTLRPVFDQRIRILMADPAQLLSGPGYPTGSACIVYAVSLLEQLPSRRVVQVLTGAAPGPAARRPASDGKHRGQPTAGRADAARLAVGLGLEVPERGRVARAFRADALRQRRARVRVRAAGHQRVDPGGAAIGRR